MSGIAAVSRADLVRCLQQLDGEAIAHWSMGLGFVPREARVQEAVVAEAPPQETASLPEPSQMAEPEVLAQPLGSRRVPALTFWRVASWEPVAENELELQGPDWFRKAEVLQAGEGSADPRLRPPRSRPLVAWSKLWPRLRKLLGAPRRSGKMDVERAVARCARVQPLFPLQERMRWSWSPSIQVWVDRRLPLAPFWQDFDQLIQGLRGLCGQHVLEVRQLDQGILGPSRHWGKLGPTEPLNLSPAASVVLAVGDMGCYDADAQSRHAWVQWGRRLKAAGVRLAALVPCPPRLWKTHADDPWQRVFWDRGLGKGPALTSPSGVETLLRLLSAAVVVEPALLRAVRMSLPAALTDVGSEWEAWWHPRMNQTVQAVSLKEEAWEPFRADYPTLPLANETLALIQAHHVHRSPFIQAEEFLISETLLGRDQAVDALMARVARSLGPDAYAGLRAWFGRLSRRQHAAMWANPQLASGFVRAFPDEPLPEGLRPETVAFAQLGELKEYALRVVGRNWTDAANDGQGSPLLTVRSRGFLGVAQAEGYQAYRLGQEPLFEGSFLGERLSLHTDVATWALERVARPEWAEAIGRDGLGLFVQCQGRKLYWLNPGELPVAGVSGGLKVKTGRWLDEPQFRILTLEGIPCPKGASRLGLDEVGVYADYAFKGIAWRMRLILPDRFMMGSPKNETKRYDDELLHEVVLSRAFWLAETACTQALWEAVMGKKPSHFKGPERPVENISWKEVQVFLKKLGTDCDMRLPSEAEWEFACRAGTQTPFSFGHVLDWRQVNFNANFPYDDQAKGEFRGETVGVKELPANAWGLYQMHGNIWEWCADFLGNYPAGTSVDPGGPGTGAERVLRGGSWDLYGRDVRAAYRFAFEPGLRFQDFGFRLARGLGLK